MRLPDLFGKTPVLIGATFFAIWILLPLFLIVVCALLKPAGSNIDLLYGFLWMVSVTGFIFGASFAAAVFFKKPWLIAAPIVYLVASSVYYQLRPPKTKTQVFVPNAAPEPSVVLAASQGTSLVAMLHFATPFMSKQTESALSSFIQNRQDELAQFITNRNGFNNNALIAARFLDRPSPAVLRAVSSQAQSLIQQLQRFNELNLASDCAHLAPHLNSLFLAWAPTASAYHAKAALDAAPLLRQIEALASVRSSTCPAIAELHKTATASLQSLKSPTP